MTPLAHLITAAGRRAEARDLHGARVLYEEALALDPRHLIALRKIVALLLPIDPPAAAHYAARLVERAPNDEEANSYLGQALSGAGRAFDAVAPFQKAADLAPTSARAQSNLALCLMRAGQVPAALEVAQRAVALDGKLLEAHANLGHALVALRRPDEAMASYRAALAITAEHPDVLHGVATAQRALGNPTAAATALMRATAVAPNWIGALVELGIVLSELGEFDGALTAARRVTALAPHHPGYASNVLFALQYHPTVAAEDATREARDLGAKWCAQMPPLPARAPGPPPIARLRVGYVSADLYRHPVGWLGAPAILAHDRDAVHVSVYANQMIRDPLTDALKSRADRWRDIAGEPDDALAQRIQQDGIDVLVDLSGHTGGNRLPVFARRVARGQASWLGYFATTGLPTMDAVLLDDEHLSPGAEVLFSERVIRLPTGRFCYSPPDYAPAPRFPSKGGVTFGSFNNAAKLNDAVIQLWARVLAAVPDSRLVLKWRAFADPVLQHRIADRFSRSGIAMERLSFDGHSEHTAMLDQYGDIDVALDPFPFCGGLTTCEALWMGVPVVTLPGRAVLSRQSHAILTRICAPQWSARDADDYVAIAVKLAADVAERRRLRAGLRDMMRTSALCDGPAAARSLEQAYRSLLS